MVAEASAVEEVLAEARRILEAGAHDSPSVRAPLLDVLFTSVHRVQFRRALPLVSGYESQRVYHSQYNP